jgi:hypothetical protein
MKIVGLIEEDFINYKKPCMYIAFPNCTFKCGGDICQNSDLVKQKRIEIPSESLVKRYINNDLTSSIVIAGLEPFDDYDDLLNLILEFRKACDDDIVIYTGYNKDEIINQVEEIRSKAKTNIIIKFGRFITNEESHYDEMLGVNLASSNQYAERIC